MTNAEIRMSNRVFLMEIGEIKGIPGTSMVWKDEKGTREIEIPEEIRTFDEWKKLGYMVQKGQHAIAKFKIWIPKPNKGKGVKAEEEEQEEGAPKGFYKGMAHFFIADQVKPIGEGKEVKQ